MKFTDDLPLRGRIHIRHFREGRLIASQTIDNLIVSAGKTRVAQMLGGTVSGWTHMAIGTDSTAESSGDTALIAETSRLATSNSNSSNQETFTATFTFGGSATIQEAGLFTASSSGTMLARKVIGPFSGISGDTLAMSWTVTVS